MQDSNQCNDDHNDFRLSALGDELDTETTESAAELFRILGDPNRIRLISILANGEHCVGHLSELLSISQPAVSQQLRLMKHARVVKVRKEKRHSFYSLVDNHIMQLFRQCVDHVTEHSNIRRTP